MTDASQSDVLTTAGDGFVVLRTTAGSLTLDDGTASADGVAVSAHGSGNVLVQAQGASSDVLVNADVKSTSGHVTVKAPANLVMAASTNVVTAGTGSLDLLAGTGSFRMAASARIATVDGDIRVQAGDAVADQLVVGRIVASNA